MIDSANSATRSSIAQLSHERGISERCREGLGLVLCAELLAPARAILWPSIPSPTDEFSAVCQGNSHINRLLTNVLNSRAPEHPTPHLQVSPDSHTPPTALGSPSSHSPPGSSAQIDGSSQRSKSPMERNDARNRRTFLLPNPATITNGVQSCRLGDNRHSP